MREPPQHPRSLPTFASPPQMRTAHGRLHSWRGTSSRACLTRAQSSRSAPSSLDLGLAQRDCQSDRAWIRGDSGESGEHAIAIRAAVGGRIPAVREEEGEWEEGGQPGYVPTSYTAITPVQRTELALQTRFSEKKWPTM